MGRPCCTTPVRRGGARLIQGYAMHTQQFWQKRISIYVHTYMYMHDSSLFTCRTQEKTKCIAIPCPPTSFLTCLGLSISLSCYRISRLLNLQQTLNCLYTSPASCPPAISQYHALSSTSMAHAAHSTSTRQ